MFNKLRDKNNIEKVLICFLIIQPILDIYILFSDSVINLFSFSPSTIIRILMILVLFFMIILTLKFNKKKIWYIIYLSIMLIYFILHHYNCLNFNANITGTYNYSFVSELFYIIRMLLPLVVSFITYNLNFSKKTVMKIIMYIILIISGTIVLTNIFCLSFSSYGENGSFVKTNIIGWFFNSNFGYTNVEMSSRGIFNSANQIGCLLTMLLPISLYSLFEKKDLISYLTIFLQLLSLLMIGTRISSYVWIGIIPIMFLIYMYFCFYQKIYTFYKKMCINVSIIFMIGLFFLQFAPIQSRKFAKDYEDIANELQSQVNQITKPELSQSNSSELQSNTTSSKENEKIVFIKNNYTEYLINSEYIEKIYNYNYDPDFWIDVLNLPYNKRSDSRQIEKLIIQHVYEKNNNAYDKLFGMSFSRFRNADLYLEKDFEMHFYSLGIVGSFLLLGPYIMVLIVAGINLLKFKNKIKFDTISYCFSLLLMCLLGYMSGSVVDILLITIIESFISGLILYNLFVREKLCIR